MSLTVLGSGKLALALILLVILFSLTGAILPQGSQVTQAEFTRWQTEHPLATRLAAPLGLFHVFRSWPFLTTIGLLAVNTLTCTALCFRRQDGFRAMTGPDAIKRAGFFVLHLSLVLLFVGGFWSAAADLNGKIILTEGQQFIDAHDNYYQLREGPLRSERHSALTIQLEDVDIEYVQEKYPVAVRSKLAVLVDGNRVDTGIVEVNQPFQCQGLSFLLDETGFSPRLQIRDVVRGRVLADSFVALRTVKTDEGREYRDFIPLPFLKQRVVATLYPSFTQEDGKFLKAGEVPDRPLLLLEMQDSSGEVVRRAQLELGERIVLGRHTLAFTDLRRWASFRVVDDPGYPLVCVALWLCLAAMIMRYAPDLRLWLRECAPDRPVSTVLRPALQPSPVPSERDAACMRERDLRLRSPGGRP